MKKLLLVTILSLCIVSLGLLTSSGAARAATSPPGKVVHTASSAAFSQQLAALQTHCAVVNVHLNGLQHTATCAVARTQSTKGVGRVQPNSPWRDSCYSSWAMEIDNYGIGANGLWNGQLCFSGSGTVGVTIYDVNSIYNATGATQGYDYAQGTSYYYNKLFGYNEYSWGSSNRTGVTIEYLCLDANC